MESDPSPFVTSEDPSNPRDLYREVEMERTIVVKQFCEVGVGGHFSITKDSEGPVGDPKKRRKAYIITDRFGGKLRVDDIATMRELQSELIDGYNWFMKSKD
jgi:hypothetical protein